MKKPSMTRTQILFPLLLALGLTECSPPPVDLSRDCPKKSKCTDCASQTGCVWCGTECIGIGRKECAPGMIRYPEDCHSAATPAAPPPR